MNLLNKLTDEDMANLKRLRHEAKLCRFALISGSERTVNTWVQHRKQYFIPCLEEGGPYGVRKTAMGLLKNVIDYHTILYVYPNEPVRNNMREIWGTESRFSKCKGHEYHVVIKEDIFYANDEPDANGRSTGVKKYIYRRIIYPPERA